MKRRAYFAKRYASLLLIYTFIAPLVNAFPREVQAKPPLTDVQKMIHVLDRLGFGARPGDLEKIRVLGIQEYINRQLDPASINDAAAEDKAKRFEVFGMSTAEVFAKYPNPTALLRQLEGGRNGSASAAAGEPRAAQQDSETARRERQQKLQKLYRKYDLRPAAQLVPQIVGNRVVRAVYSERQLQEVMVDFWQNHFNVFSGKAAVRWYIPSYERDVLRKNALGNFKDLVVGTAQHPAMLFYLDNFESSAPNAQRTGGNGRLQRAIREGTLTPRMREQIKRRQNLTDAELDARVKRLRENGGQPARRMQRGINENYARELMELHTMGVGSGYSQNDIVEVARAFTGWTIADPRGYRRAAAGKIEGTEDRRIARLQRAQGVPDDVESGEFYFNSARHDKGPKTVLGQTVNEGGVADGLKVIDILVRQPATAKFIARKLAVRFVNDEPSEELVGRIAKAFTASNGDIKTTLRAIFSDKEFFDAENYRSKIKTPFELAVSSIRAVGGDTSSSPAFVAMLNKLGEVPYGYQAPTGYPDTADDWVNTGALLERLNFAVAIASNRIPGTRVLLKGYDTAEREKILEQAIDRILHGEISPTTKSSLLKQMQKPLPEVAAGALPDDDDPSDGDEMMTPNRRGRNGRQARLLPPSGEPEVFKIVSLVLGTPEFQRQ